MNAKLSLKFVNVFFRNFSTSFLFVLLIYLFYQKICTNFAESSNYAIVKKDIADANAMTNNPELQITFSTKTT